MNTILVWLLISIGGGHGYANSATPPALLGQFATVDECQRVAKVIRDSDDFRPAHLRCIQATVVKP